MIVLLNLQSSCLNLKTMQNFDSIIKTAQKEGIISIEKTEIIGIENQKFTL